VDRPSLTEEYLRRLTLLGRAADIDAERLAAEVADHLAEAASRYRSLGVSPEEAERRAIEEFGEVEDLVSAVASCRKGGAMARIMRSVPMAVALVASAVLLGIHMDWDSAAAGTPVQAAVVAAGVLLGISILALLARGARSGLDASSAGRAVAWLAACAALGTFSAWGGRVTVGPVHFLLAGRPYLAAVAFLALLVWGAARWMRFRVGAGFGLVVAGALSLLLNGALSGDWRPLGSIGAGQANLGMELILIGWLLAAFSWIAGAGGVPARARMAGWLTSLGRRLGATADGDRGAEPGTSL
jgi:hypothetical protein